MSYGTRRLEFILDNKSTYDLSPSGVSVFATSGTFTTNPADVKAKTDGGAAGVAQDTLGATDGLECLVAYDGPDGWKIITYAVMPYKASTPPETKISFYNPDQAIGQALCDVMSQTSFLPETSHSWVDLDGNARKLTVTTTINGNPKGRARITVNQNV